MHTPKNNITAVIFDLGRVVVDLNVTRLTSIVLNDATNPGSTRKLLQLIANELMLRYNRGEISSHDFHRALCEKYNVETSFEEFKKLWCSIFTLIPGIDELIRSLHKKLTLGILSDTNALHWQYVYENYPVLELIPNPTLSFELGITKPDPEIFRIAAKNVNTPPQNCLFIDDLQANVQAAIATGLNAIQFTDTKNLKTQLTQYNL